jgi:hypothetical protein
MKDLTHTTETDIGELKRKVLALIEKDIELTYKVETADIKLKKKISAFAHEIFQSARNSDDANERNQLKKKQEALANLEIKITEIINLNKKIIDRKKEIIFLIKKIDTKEKNGVIRDLNNLKAMISEENKIESLLNNLIKKITDGLNDFKEIIFLIKKIDAKGKNDVIQDLNSKAMISEENKIESLLNNLIKKITDGLNNSKAALTAAENITNDLKGQEDKVKIIHLKYEIIHLINQIDNTIQQHSDLKASIEQEITCFTDDSQLTIQELEEKKSNLIELKNNITKKMLGNVQALTNMGITNHQTCIINSLKNEILTLANEISDPDVKTKAVERITQLLLDADRAVNENSGTVNLSNIIQRLEHKKNELISLEIKITRIIKLKDEIVSLKEKIVNPNVKIQSGQSIDQLFSDADSAKKNAVSVYNLDSIIQQLEKVKSNFMTLHGMINKINIRIAELESEPKIKSLFLTSSTNKVTALQNLRNNIETNFSSLNHDLSQKQIKSLISGWENKNFDIVNTHRFCFFHFSKPATARLVDSLKKDCEIPSDPQQRSGVKTNK